MSGCLEAGTRVQCAAHYDNSEDNLANPDPTKAVRWGDQTWDEMKLACIDVALPVKAIGRGKARR